LGDGSPDGIFQFRACSTSQKGRNSHLNERSTCAAAPQATSIYVPACSLRRPICGIQRGPRHDFPVESSAHPLPRGLCLAMRREIHQVIQRPILQATWLAKQRRVRFIKRLLEQCAVQRRERLVTRAAMQVAIQVQTQVPTQRTTQSNVGPDVHRDILRETRGAFQRALCQGFAAAMTAAFARAADVLDRLLDHGVAADSVRAARPRALVRLLNSSRSIPSLNLQSPILLLQ
jgi:hypothetical protein